MGGKYKGSWTSQGPVASARWSLRPRSQGPADPYRPATREDALPYVAVGQENSAPLELYYEDHGSGRAVVPIEIEGGPHNIGWTHPDESE